LNVIYIKKKSWNASRDRDYLMNKIIGGAGAGAGAVFLLTVGVVPVLAVTSITIAGAIVGGIIGYVVTRNG
jgi:phage shock protein PspC (stress-responsive transcriptional regulator)